MKKIILPVLLCILLSACVSDGGSLDAILKNAGILSGTQLDPATISSGLREALQVGTENAIGKVSAVDGYFGREAIRIVMPEKFRTVSDVLGKVGFQEDVAAFEKSMNRAAENAAPRARSYFFEAIKSMSITDARTILDGGETAATEYFKDRMQKQLYDEFKPSVSRSMNAVGVARYYNQMMDRYASLPFVDLVALDLDDYITTKSIDGLFVMVAEEEKKIRSDPSARVTELLKKVFAK